MSKSSNTTLYVGSSYWCAQVVVFKISLTLCVCLCVCLNRFPDYLGNAHWVLGAKQSKLTPVDCINGVGGSLFSTNASI